MRIAILANGTRGDIQPMLALGCVLEQRGHSVKVTVNQNLAAWARRSGIEIVSLPFDSEVLLKSEAGQQLLASRDSLRLSQAFARLERDANLALSAAYVEAARGADLILSTVMTIYRGPTLSEYFGGVPHGVIATLPVIETAEFPMVLASTRSLGLGLLNRASYKLIHALGWRSNHSLIAEMRRALDLPPLRDHPPPERLASVGAYSPLLSPRPKDWRADQQVTGFMVPSPALRAQLGEGSSPAGLDAWLDAGDAPVYFGFGSMPVRDPESMLARVSAVARAKGLRALIGAGWTDFAAHSRVGDHVFVCPHFDHERVLPRCRAAVHHGGAGTTGAVLRAGLPALVASVFADQPYWAARVEQAGAGVATRFARLSCETLDAGLDRILGPEMRRAAAVLGQQLRAEQGADRAADSVERWAGVPERIERRYESSVQASNPDGVPSSQSERPERTWGARTVA
jgi:UDP:flavonoid glycosyltransferase YjiC (YdhE family)